MAVPDNEDGEGDHHDNDSDWRHERSESSSSDDDSSQSVCDSELEGGSDRSYDSYGPESDEGASGDGSDSSEEEDEEDEDVSSSEDSSRARPPSVSGRSHPAPFFRRGALPRSRRERDESGDVHNVGTLVRRRGKAKGGASQPRESPGRRPGEESADDHSREKHHDSDNDRDSVSTSGGSRYGKIPDRSGRRHRKQRKRSVRSRVGRWCRKYLFCQTRKRSTQLLVLSVAAWIFAQCYYFYNARGPGFASDRRRQLAKRGSAMMTVQKRDQVFDHRVLHDNQHHDSAQMERRRKRRVAEAREALGTAAGDTWRGGKPAPNGGPHSTPRSRPRRSDQKKKKKSSRDEEGNIRSERLKGGCSALSWHAYHFPNCNEIHEVALAAAVQKGFRQRDAADRRHDAPLGFVGAGLWRDVFTCDPHGETAGAAGADAAPPAVLKVMKSEHAYDQRNFQRHRRDALVMERLAGSRHLVPIYGYCANTVLTGAVSHTLDDVVYAREHERVKKWSPRGGYQTRPALASWMGKDAAGELLLTRESEVGRIRLALGVFRGLADLHDGDGRSEWLPIVHADLQAK